MLLIAFCFIALLLLMELFKGRADAADQRPNIVWLVQDHVPWRQFTGTGGPKPELATFERLAADGVIFNQARSIQPLCAPARASMVTGAYPHNHGITANDNVVRARNTFYPEYKAFNQYLQESGYVAGYFGKWHAGTVNALELGCEGYAPRGYGNPYNTPAYAEYLREKGLPNPIFEREWHIIEAPQFGSTLTIIDPASNGGMAGKLLTPVETHESHFVASIASDWIDQQAKAGDGRPFVLRVDTWGPHQPYFVAEPFRDQVNPHEIPEYPSFTHTFSDRPAYHQRRRNFRRERMRMPEWEAWQPLMARVYENFAQTDAAFLKVLDALERNGFAENTIIIYTADHGDIIGSGGGLFDKDAFMTEEVMSIPLVVKWPGVTDGGHRSEALVSNMDIVPTVLEMAGVKIPEKMDGESMVSLVHDPDDCKWRESLMAEHHGHLETHVFQRALYHKNYKYVAHLDDTDELYDLASDPFEIKNLITDTTRKTLLADMRSRLVKEMHGSNDNSAEAQRLIEKMSTS